jgi:malate dehydrogenase (oxaloacetate-decarboxylating)(NADP+)
MRRGDVDAMLCGTTGVYEEHLKFIREVIGLRPGVKTLAAMNMLMLPNRQVFICDTQVNRYPTAEQLAEMAGLAAEELRRFGITPRVALLSHSSFGSSNSECAQLMRDALRLIEEQWPDLEVEGEMQGDAALSEPMLSRAITGSRLTGQPNLLIMPDIDAANISYNLLKMAAGNGITVGPILLGADRPVHIIEPSSSVRRIVNMTALVVVDAAENRLTG